jgi:hypothetical protein
MATVHSALDEGTGKQIAFKSLSARTADESAERAREYFEREYHTLVQLAHPRIVTVFDYGLEGDTPYYTMELLDGGDLLEQSPLTWQKACSVARDISSALSLVHSRRMVYRDLSPRNVRCTSSGHAKLLDFGAMAPMGPAPLAVCTPAVASPEVVHRLPLDGRSDLYALGAMLYYTLTGRNAYPARTFNQLPSLWQEQPRLPSEIVPEIPPALDTLVMDLLQLDPQLRPASAAEVSERLCAIANLDADEQLPFAQAYLTTPTLVGRVHEQRKLASAIERLKTRSKGAALLVRGAPGMGRSRFLDDCVLSAKLAGLTVVRPLALSAHDESRAVARSIMGQLLEIVPDDVLQAALPAPTTPAGLREALADDGEKAGSVPLLGDQNAMRGCLLAIAQRIPLLVAVDDFERLDGFGRAIVSLLAHEAVSHPLVMVATTSGDGSADTDAARLVTGAWKELTLQPLTLEHTRVLLVSMFGDVPHMSGLVKRLHDTTQGNPQALVLLAQHLLDRGSVRYSGGVWVLPERLDASELPDTLAQAFRMAALALHDDARALARVFAMWPDQAFTAEECVTLSTHRDWPRTFRCLDQLLAASMITMSGNAYALSAKAWAEPLRGEHDTAFELRLAELFDARGDGLRTAKHLFGIDRHAQGVETLVAFAKRSYLETSTSSAAYVRLLSGLPQDWRAIFDQGLELCIQQGRPAGDWFALQLRGSSLMSQNDISSKGRLLKLAQRIARDVGLDIYASLDPALDPGARLQQALGAAAARYAETPEHERLLDPKSAMGALARGLITYIGNFSRSLDVDEWRQMPQLGPLAPLSPAIAVVERLASGFDARITGHFEQACEIYRETLELIEGTNGGGLDRTFVESVRAGILSVIGMMEAGLGLASSERHADEVAAFPLYQGSALSIRMIHRLWLGDVAGASALARQCELTRLEQAHVQSGDALSTLWALQAHAASDDLTHTRQYLEAVERLASKMHTWQPIASWARGEYDRIRGDYAAALVAIDAALAQLPEAGHQVWPFAASARVRVLCEQHRFDEAHEAGLRYLAAGEAAGLGYVLNYIRMPLAIAAARTGDAAGAWQHVRASIASFEALGARGINLGLAYETAARVAASLGNEVEVELYAALCKETFLAYPNPALAAKHQRLTRALRRKRAAASGDAPRGADSFSTMSRSQIESMMQTCGTSDERLKCGLQLLVTGASAQGGVLYGLADGRLVLRAQTDERSIPDEVEQQALRYVNAELRPDETIADTAALESGSLTNQAWTSVEGRYYKAVLLTHNDPEHGFFVSGLAVLVFDSVPDARGAADTATFLSRTMVQAGDLAPVLIAV